MTAIYAFVVVSGVTLFSVWIRCRVVPADLALSGAACLCSGLLTLLLMSVHLASIVLPTMGSGVPLDLLALNFGLAVAAAAITSVRLALGLMRGELHAQKRALVAALVILGVMLPLAAAEPFALVISCATLVQVGALLCSRTHVGQEISEAAA